MNRLARSWTVVLIACFGFASLASATHSIDTRFTVLGFVRDSDGRPVVDQSVEVVRERTGLAFRGTTDAAGFYVVVVWVRDEDRGDRLRVRANGGDLVVLATFDPSDHTTERGTRVDFDGTRAVELRKAFGETLRWFLAR